MKAWIKGALIGTFLWVLLYFSLSFICSNFYRIGPAYPTNQPVCYFLVVQSEWIYGFVLVIIGSITGWITERIKSKK